VDVHLRHKRSTVAVRPLKKTKSFDSKGGELLAEGDAIAGLVDTRYGHDRRAPPVRTASTQRTIAVDSPVRSSSPPFESKLLVFLKGRTATVERLVTEMYVHGLSTRDIELAFTDATGRAC